MLHNEKLRIIQQIDCPICQNYGWHLVRMTPARDPAGAWHHPSCPTIRAASVMPHWVTATTPRR